MRMSKIVPALSLAVALAAGLISCKKEQAEAIVTVSVGEVQVVAADGTAAAAVPGMALTEKVTLVTGRDSMAMIQLGAEAVIKIQPESKLVLAEIMNPAKKLVLEEGVVLARLRKLEKDSAFSIQTETQIASVRGTTFRVASDGAVSTVSVGEGMVEVKPASGEAVVLNAGERALCEADKAVTKEKNTDVEKTELEEMAALPEISPEQVNQPAAMAGYSQKVEASFKETRKKVDELEAAQPPKTLEEMKKRFGRLDQITLFSGRTITGVIMQRGAAFTVLVEGGTTMTVPASQVRNTSVIQ